MWTGNKDKILVIRAVDLREDARPHLLQRMASEKIWPGYGLFRAHLWCHENTKNLKEDFEQDCVLLCQCDAVCLPEFWYRNAMCDIGIQGVNLSKRLQWICIKIQTCENTWNCAVYYIVAVTIHLLNILCSKSGHFKSRKAFFLYNKLSFLVSWTGITDVLLEDFDCLNIMLQMSVFLCETLPILVWKSNG